MDKDQLETVMSIMKEEADGSIQYNALGNSFGELLLKFMARHNFCYRLALDQWFLLTHQYSKCLQS